MLRRQLQGVALASHCDEFEIASQGNPQRWLMVAHCTEHVGLLDAHILQNTLDQTCVVYCGMALLHWHHTNAELLVGEVLQTAMSHHCQVRAPASALGFPGVRTDRELSAGRLLLLNQARTAVTTSSANV